MGKRIAFVAFAVVANVAAFSGRRRRSIVRTAGGDVDCGIRVVGVVSAVDGVSWLDLRGIVWATGVIFQQRQLIRDTV